MTTIETKSTIPAPAATVWRTISAFHGIERWLPPVRASSVEGDGLGALRTCVFHDGGVVRERLIELDDRAWALRYEIVDAGPLPVRGYVATMRVRPLGDDRCELSWSATFEATAGDADALAGMLRGVYAAGAEGLGRITRSAA